MLWPTELSAQAALPLPSNPALVNGEPNCRLDARSSSKYITMRTQKKADMFKTILLGTDGSAGAAAATRSAVWLAGQLHARLVALHIMDIRILEGPLLADIAGALGAQPYPALVARVKQFQTERATTILEAVAKICRDQGVACECVHQTGGLLQTLLQHEPPADLVVLGQRGEHAQWHAELLGASLERLVRGSTKPCLVVPENCQTPQNILIAHDGSAESTKALHLGLQLASALKTGVTLVTACPREQADAAAKILQAAQALAQVRGLAAHAQLIHDNAENAILQVAGELPAGLIVMGAYGHTRIREWILGSTTSHVLRQARIPVLLARGL